MRSTSDAPDVGAADAVAGATDAASAAAPTAPNNDRRLIGAPRFRAGIPECARAT
ncbi:hypothetical protein WSS_A10712 [Rhodococcus opacus M213]|uniref:Uncharacterized protein n=1 Tax=Rhodococcus opacus M213 TaxID=1129896 RepID=K8XMP4_RHOOP|nr:hypothetical protein WSS_A10712 [Rhodococcus opacus M213]